MTQQEIELHVSIPKDYPDIYVQMSNKTCILDMCVRLKIFDNDKIEKSLKIIEIINDHILTDIIKIYLFNFKNRKLDLYDFPSLIQIFTHVFNENFKKKRCFHKKKYSFEDFSQVYKILIFFMKECCLITDLNYTDDTILRMIDRCLKLLEMDFKNK
jgi:hypothetical protein